MNKDTFELTFSMTNVHSLSSNSSAWGSCKKQYFSKQTTTELRIITHLKQIFFLHLWGPVKDRNSYVTDSSSALPNLILLSVHPLTWFIWPISLVIHLSNVCSVTFKWATHWPKTVFVCMENKNRLALCFCACVVVSWASSLSSSKIRTGDSKASHKSLTILVYVTFTAL